MDTEVLYAINNVTDLPVTNDIPIESQKENMQTEPLRNFNIPYILNGELYEIQTQDGEKVTVRCCNCPPDRLYRGSVRSTGNFHMHIKRRHPDLLGRLHDMKVSALVERRDRLMRSRRSTQRVVTQIIKRRSTCRTSSTNIYKLKIHTAFKRHQQQKQQQRLLSRTPFTQNWRIAHEQAEPINFSRIDSSQHEQQQQQQRESEHIAEKPNNGGEKEVEYIQPVYSNQQIFKTDNDPLQYQEELQEQHALHLNSEEDDNCAISAANVSFVTNVPSCSNSTLSQVDEQNDVIDLSIPNRSNLQSTSVNSSGIGSIGTFNDNEKISGATNATANLQYTDWLMQMQTVMRELQCELRTRNQIESNRILLDIAKFKYLHPDFNFPA